MDADDSRPAPKTHWLRLPSVKADVLVDMYPDGDFWLTFESSSCDCGFGKVEMDRDGFSELVRLLDETRPSGDASR